MGPRVDDPDERERETDEPDFSLFVKAALKEFIAERERKS